VPLSRDEARKNLIGLIQFQKLHEREYGGLLLAAWYGMEDEAQDLFLFEVYGNFKAPDGNERALLRFPGMGNLWLPGLYHVLAMSKAEFESRAHSNDPDIDAVRRDIRSGNGEILWPENPDDETLALLLLD
jgi:hypothetical protein